MGKIIIFGASGFLGTHVKQKLEHDIFSINIRDVNWQSIIPNDAEIFINCIGKAHDHQGKFTEKDYYEANYEVVKKIYNSFLKSNAVLFIHISSLATVEEYSRNTIINEESICNPISYYGKSKKKAEEFLLEQNLPSGKKIVILRPSMIHGEGDKGNLTLLYKIISKGVPYPLGAFHNSRTFISIDNMVFFINEIIKKKDQIKTGIYNVTDDSPFSTKQIIEIIGKVEGKTPNILSVPKQLIKFFAKIGDIVPLPINSKRLGKMTSNLLVSNQKIKNVLNIKALPLSAEEGLIKTIQSFKNTSS